MPTLVRFSHTAEDGIFLVPPSLSEDGTWIERRHQHINQMEAPA